MIGGYQWAYAALGIWLPWIVIVVPFSYTLRTNSIQGVTHFIFKLI